MKNLFIALLCFLAAPLLAETPSPRLEYLPNIPIIQTSELTLELTQSLPGLKLNANANQTLTATLSIVGEQSGIPMTQPPLTLKFVLKDLKINLKSNNEEVKFDVKDPKSALELAQLARIVDRPIELRFGKNFELQNHPEELQQILRELPMLQEFRPESLLQELFQHLFAFADKDLAVGLQIQQRGPIHPLSSEAPIINYEITSLNDQEVRASIAGKMDKQTIQLKHPLANGTVEPIEFTLMGALKGNATWNRHHALIYQLDVEYTYTGLFKIAEANWLTSVLLRHKIESKKS